MPKLRKWLKRRPYQPTFAISKIADRAQPTRATAQFDAEPAQHLVPYDEHLLERSRTQWQFGDWASLAALSQDTLQHHPDRAKLALLAAAGHAQLGQTEPARQYTRLAQDWGCSKKLVAQVLISGTHNSLARAAAVSGRPEQARSHFEHAVRIGMPHADASLLTPARAQKQLADMGLLTAATYQQLTALEAKTSPIRRHSQTPTNVSARVAQCLASDDVHATVDHLIADPALSPVTRFNILIDVAQGLLGRKDKMSATNFLRQAMRLPDTDQPDLQVKLVKLLVDVGRSDDAAEHMLQRTLRSLPPLALDPKTADLIAQAHAATRAVIEKKSEHGHDLLLSWLTANLKQMAPSAKPRILIEIGTTREDVPGQGSTAKIAAFCKANGLHFITVDMDPHNSLMAAQAFKASSTPFEAITAKGEDYLRQYPGQFDFIFLDAYDFDHGNHSELRQSRYEKFLGARIDEEQCHQMHLECAQSVLTKLAPDGVVCMDDTWLDKGAWTAKGTLAMPYFLQHGFHVIEARNRAALLVRTPTAA